MDAHEAVAAGAGEVGARAKEYRAWARFLVLLLGERNAQQRVEAAIAALRVRGAGRAVHHHVPLSPYSKSSPVVLDFFLRMGYVISWIII